MECHSDFDIPTLPDVCCQMVFAGHHLVRNAKTWWNIVTALVMTKLGKHFRNLDQCRALWNVLHPDGYASCNIVRFVREPLDVLQFIYVFHFSAFFSLVLPMDHPGVVAARSAEEELEQRLQLEAMNSSWWLKVDMMKLMVEIIWNATTAGNQQ